ncbi:hypothetical protein AXF42_Ash019950 [Apostasia shenzhenica]|uniref:Uncharacterized protein n=1 Tax=Apostasia shenzhenica TaxID=1088818 RepID=A0A2I0AZI7_9ASPA|nr:hypothetical protein AXF42_Ash019950 [Apostasia shenzhenica]
MFLSCFQEYSLLIASFTPPVTHSSRESFVIGVSGNNLATQGSSCTNEPALRCMSSSSFSNTRFITWNFTEALAVDLKQFSITLAVPDHLGKAQEFVLEVDVFISLLSFGKKLILDLSRLSVFSNRLHKSILNESREMPTLHFYSKMPISSTSQNSSKSGLKGSECESSQRVDAYASSPSDFQNKVGSSLFGSYCHHSILKHMAGTVTVEKLNLEDDNLTNEYNSNWAGRGAISGLNLMIHLWDIQTILALCALFSDILPSEVNGSSMQNLDGGQNFRFEESESDYKIPDGAIVAVQDLHQHMYFTVERLDDKYHLVGALHYSLVGERALFKVKYHRRWRSRVPCMSFLSLYAKNKEGQPLCMSFNPGSGFVGISGSNGKRASLWETFQNEFGCFEDNYADDFRTFSSARKAFHLVNLKNDSSVAFVNGMPEFVRKPGNPFKVKLFDWSILGKGFAELVSRSLSDNDYDTQCPGELSGTIGDRSDFHYNYPHVNIVVHVATLTILHDVSDVDDPLPLFRCCLNKFTIIGQILLTKLRIISLFSVVLQLFDAITNSWKEIMAPVDSVLFYRSRFTQLDRLIRSHGVPRHFFFHSTQVDITLTEISLDILLYLAGKMDLAGPYAVRQSSIFRNCCKLVNCTGLIVYCHFPKKEKVVLSPGQSSSVFLRFAALDGQLPESDRSMSISLCDNGGISTLPLDVSLSNACHFAWRTRIVSPKDSKTLPGPFIVIEVVHNDEEGLSVAISPLLKIHNESKLSMELQFRRPGETTTESASILLETGDSVDDSIAVFDALDFHGGSKRTLLSLSLGNFLLSLRPRINKYDEDNERNILLNWSEEIKGGKALRISGLFDKLNYRLRNALGVGPAKSFFSSLHCSITLEGQPFSNLYFIIHTIRTDVPLFQPQNVGDATVDRTSPVATQLQKEIFVYPTVQVYNLLQSEILVLLIDSHPDIGNVEFANIGREATMPCHSSSYFYANPDNMHFRVTLNAYGSSSKPVNCGVWVNNLERKRNDVHFVDIELDFGGGTYFAFLRLSSSDTGTIKATIFTTYTLENNSEHSLVCSANLKSHTW